MEEKAYFNSDLSEGLRLNMSASFMFISFPADVRFICVNFRNTVFSGCFCCMRSHFIFLNERKYDYILSSPTIVFALITIFDMLFSLPRI